MNRKFVQKLIDNNRYFFYLLFIIIVIIINNMEQANIDQTQLRQYKFILGKIDLLSSQMVIIKKQFDIIIM